MASLRKALTEASEAHWSEYLAALSERQPKEEDEEVLSEAAAPQLGEWIHLADVDYTRQVEVRGAQVVFHDDEDRRPWAILIDRRFSALIALGADIELAFGFGRMTRWDLVGRIAGFDFVFDDYAFRTRKVPTLRVNALHREGQFVVFHHPKHGPQAPGLSDAREKLEAIHAKLTIPPAKEPKELLDTLLTIIETCNLTRFRELSVVPPDPRMLRRRFEHFIKAYAACGGRVVFDRYDPRRSPETPGPEGEVKMFVERFNEDGSRASRPLTFIRVDGRWRLKTGML